MRAFQRLMSLTAVGIAGGLVQGQVSAVAMGDPVKAPHKAALQVDEAPALNPMQDPEVVERIIGLIESGDRDKALELIERVMSGEPFALADPCTDGWLLDLDANTTARSLSLSIDGDLLVAGGDGSVSAYQSSYTFQTPPGHTPITKIPEWTETVNGFDPPYASADEAKADDNSFVYALMSDSFPSKFAVTKFAPRGGTIWTNDYSFGSRTTIIDFGGTEVPASDAKLRNLEISDEGVPFVQAIDGVYKLNPFTGGVMWVYDDDVVIELSGIFVEFVQNGILDIALDDRGDVFVVRFEYDSIQATNNNNGKIFVEKLSGASGTRLWRTEIIDGQYFAGAGIDNFYDEGAFFSNMDFRVETDSKGDVVMLGSWFGGGNLGFQSIGSAIVKLDSQTGNRFTGWGNDLAGTSLGNPIYTDFAIDRDDNVVVLAQSRDVQPFGAEPTLYRYASNSNSNPEQATFTVGGVRDKGRLALDRAGNIYLSVINASKTHVTGRIDDDLFDGTFLWMCDTDPREYTRINSLIIDGGGSLFVSLYEVITDNSLPPNIISTNGYLRKLEQTVDLPLEFEVSPTFALENRSVWPGDEGQVESEIEIFNPSWNQFFGIGGFIDSWFFDDTGAGIGVITEGDVYAGFKAEIEGGTMDLSFPIDARWETGGTLVASGLPVNVDASWEMDPGASFSTNSEPDFNAGITGGLNFSLVPNVSVKFDGDDLLNENLFDPLVLSLDRGYILSLGVFREFIDLAAADGEYVTVPTEIPGVGKIPGLDSISIKMRNPKLNAQGLFGSVAPFTGAASVTSFARNEIAEINFSITNWLMNRYVETNPTLCPPLWQIPGTAANTLCDLNKQIYTLSHTHGIDLGVISLNARLELLQMKLQATFEVNQGLNLEVTPKVRYEVTDGNGNAVPFMVRSGKTAQGIENQPVAGDPAVGTTLDFEVGSTLPDLQINMPSSGIIQITPYVYAETMIENNTGAGVIPGINWTLLKMGLSARAFGFGLPSVSLPDISTRTDFVTIPVPLYDEPAFLVKTPEIELTPIRIPGLRPGEEAPKLTAGSRTSLPMIIYDQTSPTQSSFNNIAFGSLKMLLFGDRFSLVGEDDPFDTATYVVPVVKISHHGRVEELVSKRLNASTIVVEIPNRFRLLPGVARIWVERDHLGVTQSTGTIDLPIEFPVPQLDAVNPNLWAADPDMFTIPMQVIDRKTLLGSDTFITRRDYYVKMRDELWNSTTAGGTDADAYFPCFDFDKMPEFPAVLFGTRNSQGQYEMNPLSRFIQPIDSGIHNVRLAERNYDTPGVVPVMICNPGPGGGASETLFLNIAAPIPVASRLEPSEAEPGGELDEGQYAMELIVRGPRHVPTWDDYEEPKFSNFNRDSVVYFDGEAVPTRFVDSSEIRAMVPDYLLQVEANYRLEVFTPHNDSKYLEKKWSDPDGDGVFDSPTLAAIDSGGWSAPIFFPVRWRSPVIETLNPPAIEMGNPAFALSTPQNPVPMINFGVLGQNFREGSVVLVNGEPRYTEFVSREMLNVRLEAQDVATLARRLISVRNPGWDPDESEMVELEITSPKVAPYFRRGP